jgi:GNAT superfamily N-acetyltransferase
VAPGGVRWGPLEPGDRADAEAMLTSAEVHDRTGPRILHGWRHQLGPSTDNPSYTRAARAADGTMVALGWLSTRPHDDPPRRIFLAGAVHPDHRGRGLGHALLEWQLDVARGWQRETGGDQIAVLASAPPSQGDARRLLAGAGFEPVRVFAELTRALPATGALSSSPESRALSSSKGIPGITLERFSTDRAEDVRRALNAAFAEHWGARPVLTGPWQSLLATDTFRPDWSWVALDESSEVAGFVLNSAEPHPDHGPVGWTDQLGVLPPWRGRGLGRALMVASLAAFEDAGLRMAGLGLDTQNPFGAPALYAALGYRRGHEVHLFMRSEPALQTHAAR